MAGCASVALALAVAPTALTAASGPACTGPMLAGSFRAVPGSEGAGNIVYRLALRNRSSATCFVRGIPGLTLLDGKGHALPSHASFSGPRGMLSAVMVVLAPGRSAALGARFSPDIPGPGEPQTGKACEPTATTLRVVVSGGGALLAAISPPTPVCEHGALQVTNLVAV